MAKWEVQGQQYLIRTEPRRRLHSFCTVVIFSPDTVRSINSGWRGLVEALSLLATATNDNVDRLRMSIISNYFLSSVIVDLNTMSHFRPCVFFHTSISRKLFPT